jgi:hypothetical protein
MAKIASYTSTQLYLINRMKKIERKMRGQRIRLNDAHARVIAAERMGEGKQKRELLADLGRLRKYALENLRRLSDLIRPYPDLKVPKAIVAHLAFININARLLLSRIREIEVFPEGFEESDSLHNIQVEAGVRLDRGK